MGNFDQIFNIQGQKMYTHSCCPDFHSFNIHMKFKKGDFPAPTLEK